MKSTREIIDEAKRHVDAGIVYAEPTKTYTLLRKLTERLEEYESEFGEIGGDLPSGLPAHEAEG